MRALVVAAHGHGDGSATNQRVAELTRQAARLGQFEEWGQAFHQGRPTFGEALKPLQAASVVVVPLLTSEGYYLDKLRRNLQGEFRLTQPVGTSPWLPDLVARRVQAITPDLSQTSLLLVGHGSQRNQHSREATQQLARSLAQGPLREVRWAYLDEDPTPEQVVGQLVGRYRLIIPFLIGPGDHALVDLPRRLATPPGWQQQTYLDQPLAHDPCLAELIAERACGRLPGFAPLGGQKRWSIS